MLRYFLLLLCVVFCLTCAYRKQKWTDADFASLLKIEKRFHEAEYHADYDAMLAHTNKILDFLSRFSANEDVVLLHHNALLQRGDIFIQMRHREHAESDFDVVIAESMYLPLRMKAFRYKMMAASLSGKQGDADLDKYGEIVRDLFVRIKKDPNFKFGNPDTADALVIYGEAMHVWGVSLLEREQPERAEKIYLDYLLEYKNDSDLKNTFPLASLSYYNLSRACRMKKDFGREELYLKKCLSLLSEKNFVYAGMFLRTGAYAIRSGQYDLAIKYCDDGLVWGSKQAFPTEKYRRDYNDILLAGKMKIYRKMNLPEKAEECARRIKGPLSAEVYKKIDQLLFSF